jgi:hypothetical protein
MERCSSERGGRISDFDVGGRGGEGEGENRGGRGQANPTIVLGWEGRPLGVG